MNTNGEVITGSDFKRMITGAYSEFLLEYENINALEKKLRPAYGAHPGTNILRTMGAAIMPIADTKDDSIGGLSRRVAAASILGARGNSGVVLSQLFRGIAKGLIGKFEATSSEFGKAFQYGILYAQRVLPEEPERPIVTAARAVAKGAYHAVRANLPITEILAAAITAGERPGAGGEELDVGERIMLTFLIGCHKGLNGNFVSPVLNFSAGSKDQRATLPDPRLDIVHPYCLTFVVRNMQADPREVERFLQEKASLVVVERRRHALHIHLHTEHPGVVLEYVVGLGPVSDIRLNNMAEPHSMVLAHSSLMPVALLAISRREERAQRLTELGATLITVGEEGDVPTVGALVNAAHSDLAESYVIVSDGPRMSLELRQVKRILGDRVEIVIVASEAEQEAAIRSFDRRLSAAKNAERMKERLWDK
ncbi:MAG: DAK2 domain-containing protein [Schwartzia sp.]|nr:DAK2 domain-containing protein [Schwartzia sp. (in: firmicutes)]